MKKKAHSSSAELYQLIQSLTPSEKKFFTQWAGRHVIGQENQYVSLYEVLSQQPEYSEEALRLHFAQTPVAEHLGVYKRQLYEKVCESLHHFHTAQNTREQIKRDLHVAAILTEKRLYAQADKLLRRCLRELENYELWELFPEWMEKKRALTAANAYRDATEAVLADWQQQEAAQWERIIRYGQLWLTGCRVARLHQQQIRPGDEAAISQLESWMNTPAMALPEDQLSDRERLEKWSTLARYHFITRRPELAYTYNLRQLELMDRRPQWVRLYPHRYVAVFHNLLIDSFAIQQLDELERRLEQWRRLPARRELQRMPHLAQRTAELGLLLELNLLKAQGRWQQAAENWSRLAEAYRQTSARMAAQRRMSCEYLLAYLAFRQRRWDESTHWQNLILQSGARQAAEELYDFTAMLQLLTHFKLGHYEFLAYKIESTRRQYASGRPAGPWENLALRFLRRLVNQPEAARHGLLAQWREALAAEPDPRAADYFPFPEWIDEEIQATAYRRL